MEKFKFTEKKYGAWKICQYSKTKISLIHSATLSTMLEILVYEDEGIQRINCTWKNKHGIETLYSKDILTNMVNKVPKKYKIRENLLEDFHQLAIIAQGE